MKNFGCIEKVSKEVFVFSKDDIENQEAIRQIFSEKRIGAPYFKLDEHFDYFSIDVWFSAEDAITFTVPAKSSIYLVFDKNARDTRDRVKLFNATGFNELPITY